MISACLILCDDGKHIEKCLKSILYLDEIIIVIDKKSKDKTEKIVRKYAKENKHIRVFKREWKGFSNQRNFSMSKATGDHILIIDGDEELESKYPLHDYIKKYKADIYKVKIENKKDNVIRYCDNLRMWEKGFKYDGLMHENINQSILKESTKRKIKIVNLKTVILKHYGYDLKPKEMDKKLDRNFKHHLDQKTKEPNNPIINYHLGMLYKNKGEINKALDYMFLALETDTLGKDHRAMLYNKIAVIYYELGEVDKALKYLDKSFNEIPNQCQGRYLLVDILKGTDIKKALRIAKEIKEITKERKSDLQNDSYLELSEIDSICQQLRT